jgi:hypothetical protein
MPLLILAQFSASQLRQLTELAGAELHWDHNRQDQEYRSCAEKWLSH